MSLTPRLACIKPAASVHPEPGSNSSLYKYFSKNLYLQDPDCLLKVLSFDRGLPAVPFLLAVLHYVYERPLLRGLHYSFLFPVKRECKSNAFFFTNKLFLKKNLIFFHSFLSCCKRQFYACKTDRDFSAVVSGFFQDIISYELFPCKQGGKSTLFFVPYNFFLMFF